MAPEWSPAVAVCSQLLGIAMLKWYSPFLTGSYPSGRPPGPAVWAGFLPASSVEADPVGCPVPFSPPAGAGAEPEDVALSPLESEAPLPEPPSPSPPLRATASTVPSTASTTTTATTRSVRLGTTSVIDARGGVPGPAPPPGVDPEAPRSAVPAALDLAASVADAAAFRTDFSAPRMRSAATSEARGPEPGFSSDSGGEEGAGGAGGSAIARVGSTTGGSGLLPPLSSGALTASVSRARAPGSSSRFSGSLASRP